MSMVDGASGADGHGVGVEAVGDEQADSRDADVSGTVASAGDASGEAPPARTCEGKVIGQACSEQAAVAASSSLGVLQEQGGNSQDSDAVNLHVSCRDFARVSGEKLKQWLSKMSPVSLQKVFKLNQWNYAFVTVLPEDVPGFRGTIDGLTYRKSAVSVNDGHPRDTNNRRPKCAQGDEPSAKRQKVKDFPVGYVPTLKDIKDRIKQCKSSGTKEGSVVQKSAPLLEYPYETQLTMKGTYVKSAVRAFTKQVKRRCEDKGEEPPPWTTAEWSISSQAPIGCCCPLEPPIGTAADHRCGYRNKCEFTIGKTEAGDSDVGFVLGILGDGDQIVASCEDVPHVPAVMKRLCAVVRKCVSASPFAVFDRRRNAKTGVWRLVMARLSPTGDMLVLLQTATLSEEDRSRLTGPLVSALTSADLGVVSVYLQFNDEVTDAARPDAPLLHIHGAPQLRMPLLGLGFEIGPLSFFQANTATCGALYETALQWLRPAGAVVLDVCCGVGTIGLCAAGRCRQVIGVELVPEAVESARRNAALNGIENASFHLGRAEDVLPEVLHELGSSASEVCAVVDPPRPGLHHAVTTALRSCAQLSRIVYVSCNPDSLVEDVLRLTVPQDSDADPFVPVRAVAVDMFPHTLHCEMVLLLERASRVPDPRGGPASEAQEPSAPAGAEAGGATSG